MNATEFSQQICADSKGSGKRVAAIGRWMPVHNGHKKFLVDLARNYDKLIIMIGSCYQGGDIRHCISTTEREKMLRAIMRRENIPDEKYDIIPIPDFPTFDEWIKEVTDACKEAGVTHFCSGNKEEILNVLNERDDDFNMEIIDPEETTEFPYHATDIRNMIVNGEYDKIQKIIPDETKPILFQYTFKEIIAASDNRGINFIEGRQTVDMLFLVKNIKDGKTYVLLGKRPTYKKDFPGVLALPGGGIERFETPIKAAIRKFEIETGLKVKLLDNSLEPAIIKFEGTTSSQIEQLCRIGIYGTNDESLNGTRGGSSECFGIFVEGDLDEYKKLINPRHGLTDVMFYDAEKALDRKLAYQHHDMLLKAMNMFKAQGLIETPKRKDTFVISFIGGPGTGKSLAGLKTTYDLKMKGYSAEYVDEFAKRMVYDGTLNHYIPDQAYIIANQYTKIYDVLGHVDYIVTDAGLEISAYHASGEKVIEQLAWYLSESLNSLTIFIERNKTVEYETAGRIETADESDNFSRKFEEYLKSRGANFIKVVGQEEATKAALDFVLKRNGKE